MAKIEDARNTTNVRGGDFEDDLFEVADSVFRDAEQNRANGRFGDGESRGNFVNLISFLYENKHITLPVLIALIIAVYTGTR